MCWSGSYGLNMGSDAWEKNAEYFSDTDYFGETHPNFYSRVMRKSVKLTPDLLVGDKINAVAYAERFFQRRYDGNT